jgi:hypothetical protein
MNKAFYAARRQGSLNKRLSAGNIHGPDLVSISLLTHPGSSMKNKLAAGYGCLERGGAS